MFMPLASGTLSPFRRRRTGTACMSRNRNSRQFDRGFPTLLMMNPHKKFMRSSGSLMRNSFTRRAIAHVLGCALALSPFSSEIALADQEIGNTQVVVNDVRGVIGTQEPAVLHAGIDVFQNEVVRTGEKSASRVKFQDNTDLSVGPSSEVTLDHFVFDPDPTKSQVALSIAKGVARFTTGSLPKSAYRISTPTATIGVRGTVLTI